MNLLDIVIKDQSTATLEGDESLKKAVMMNFRFRPDGYQFAPNYQFGIWDGWIYPIKPHTFNFGKGLINEIIRKNPDIKFNIINNNKSIDLELCNIDNISNGKDNITPYDYQITGAEYILSNKSGIIESPTGSGKSLLQYLIVKSLLNKGFKKILILVPTVSLVDQLFGDFKDYSFLDESFDTDNNCHLISGGKEKSSDKPVYISTWQSIYTIKDKKYFKEFDAVLVDECHLAPSKSISNILMSCINAIVKGGFSGTLEDTEDNMISLLGLFGDVFKTATTRELMDRGILSDILVKSLILKHKHDNGFMEYKDEIDYLVSHEKRNKLITNLASSLDGNTLILFDLVQKHGKVLLKILKDEYPDKDIYYVSGEVKKSKREEIRKLLEDKDDAIIIASYKTFQAGINIKRLHNVIFASPSKSKIRIFQSIGRGLRTHSTKSHATIYDLCDDLRCKTKRENYALQHFRKRVELYKKEKFKMKVMELDI